MARQYAFQSLPVKRSSAGGSAPNVTGILRHPETMDILPVTRVGDQSPVTELTSDSDGWLPAFIADHHSVVVDFSGEPGVSTEKWLVSHADPTSIVDVNLSAVDTAVAAAQTAQEASITANVAADRVVDLDAIQLSVNQFGAFADGIHDDAPAFNAALRAAHDAGGGTVYVPPGAYTVFSAIGDTENWLQHVRLIGSSPRGVRWTFGDGATDPDGKPWVGAAMIRAAADIPIITGLWENSEISGIGLDADMRGNSCIKAHISKTVLDGLELVGWSGYGMLLNNGDLTNDLGFLNRIQNCNVSDTGEENGVGIQLEYRFIDSWIINNNIESPHTDLQINSGGPFRIIGNHFNGNRSPQHNILINGGVRECLIAHNILEGPRDESIKYTAPGWLTEPERASISITGNIVRQAGQSETGKPIFGFYGKTSNAGFRAHGLTITGNVISTDYNLAGVHTIQVEGFDDVALTGNYWRAGHDPALAPVKLVDSTGVEVIGNHGDNSVLGGVNLAATRGDVQPVVTRVWTGNVTLSLPSSYAVTIRASVTGNVVLALPTGIPADISFTVTVVAKQQAGPWQITLPPDLKTAYGLDSVLTQTPGAEDELTFFYRGGDWSLSVVKEEVS